jgi:hypothetical protein
MTTEQRLSALERSVARWRIISFVLVLLIVARFFIGADFIPNDAKFDKITAKSITVDGGDAWIDIKADGTTASIALMSAEHEKGNLRFHNLVLLDASKEQSTISLNSLNHALVTRQDAGKVLNESKKEGVGIEVSPEHSTLKMIKIGKPFVGIATESPSLVIQDAARKSIFEK